MATNLMETQMYMYGSALVGDRVFGADNQGGTKQSMSINWTAPTIH